MEKLKFQKYSLRRKQRRRHTNLRNYAAFIITTIFVVVTASCVKSAHLNVNTNSVPAITVAAAAAAAASASELANLPAVSSSLPADSLSLQSVQKLKHLTEDEEDIRAEAAEEAVEIELQESSLYNLPVVRELKVATTLSTTTTTTSSTTTTMNALNTAIDTDENTRTKNSHTNAQDINSINTQQRRRNIPTHSDNNFSLQENILKQQLQQQHTRHPQYQHQHFDRSKT